MDDEAKSRGIGIAIFFTLVPLFPLGFMGFEDGWVDLSCSGDPWTCQVEKWNVLSRTAWSYAPHQFFVTRTYGTGVGARGATYSTTRYGLGFDGVTVLEKYDKADLEALAAELSAAKATGDPFHRSVRPRGPFFAFLVMTVLFAALSAFVWVVAIRQLRQR